MTFPRVHHADYFSDSGPVDGTVLVNSHSDAIEALQSLETVVTDAASAPATPNVTAQLMVITDGPDTGGVGLPELFFGQSGAWNPVSAVDGAARTLIGDLTPAFRASMPTGVAQEAQSGYDSTTYIAYIWHSSAWHAVGAVDATARSAASAAQTDATNALNGLGPVYPVFGVGNPTATSQPTDGSVNNYYDTTASTYVHWVFNPDDTAFHQVA